MGRWGKRLACCTTQRTGTTAPSAPNTQHARILDLLKQIGTQTRASRHSGEAKDCVVIPTPWFCGPNHILTGCPSPSTPTLASLLAVQCCCHQPPSSHQLPGSISKPLQFLQGRIFLYIWKLVWTACFHMPISSRREDGHWHRPESRNWGEKRKILRHALSKDDSSKMAMMRVWRQLKLWDTRIKSTHQNAQSKCLKKHTQYCQTKGSPWANQTATFCSHWWNNGYR